MQIKIRLHDARRLIRVFTVRLTFSEISIKMIKNKNIIYSLDRPIQPEGTRIMPETRFTELPALSVDRGLGFLSLHRSSIFDYFSNL